MDYIKAQVCFEFKFNESAVSALQQCREKNYAGRFVGDKHSIYYVGVNYNPAGNV